MVNLLARDAVVRDVVWGTMSLLRFVQPVRSFGWQAGCRRLAGGARRNGPRYAADVIDPAILRTFLALRAPRNGCGRNELRAGIDAVEWVRELRRSIAVIVDSHAADAAARIAESQPGPRRTDAAGSRSMSRGGIPRVGRRSVPPGQSQHGKWPRFPPTSERRDFRKRIHIMRNTTAWTHFRYPESGQRRPVSQPAAARTGTSTPALSGIVAGCLKTEWRARCGP